MTTGNSGMPAIEVQFKRLEGNNDLPLPEYATQGAAAFDLRAAVASGTQEVLQAGSRILIETGFAVAIPEGYEMQIRPRSGLALRSKPSWAIQRSSTGLPARPRLPRRSA